ncbi:MAG: DUF2905 domain-containing protein [Bacteroidetes bacterium]|nr:DUF2905 domain-containing protein [Bacteroidota bacterium]MCW5895775.1 DUF2905 domain-containing protein [Bacteroidota bacterium]
MEFQGFGRILVVVGSVILLLGIGFMVWDKIPFLGKLPGDIRVEKENFRFYFPLTTGILLSIFISVILWIVSHFRK